MLYHVDIGIKGVVWSSMSYGQGIANEFEWFSFWLVAWLVGECPHKRCDIRLWGLWWLIDQDLSDLIDIYDMSTAMLYPIKLWFSALDDLASSIFDFVSTINKSTIEGNDWGFLTSY